MDIPKRPYNGSALIKSVGPLPLQYGSSIPGGSIACLGRGPDIHIFRRRTGKEAVPTVRPYRPEGFKSLVWGSVIQGWGLPPAYRWLAGRDRWGRREYAREVGAGLGIRALLHARIDVDVGETLLGSESEIFTSSHGSNQRQRRPRTWKSSAPARMSSLCPQGRLQGRAH